MFAFSEIITNNLFNSEGQPTLASQIFGKKMNERDLSAIVLIVKYSLKTLFVNKHFFIVLFVFFAGINLHAQNSIEAKIDSIIELLTLEEKVAMCHAQSKFTSPGVPRLGIPELMMSDGPHGVRAEVSWDSWDDAGWTSDSITAFPALTCLAATFNPRLSYNYGFAIGEEARYRRKDILLGPGVNIYRTPLNGRNFEYMGEDPFLSSSLVVPYIKGVQTQGVAACVKHYVLNNQETWRKHVNVEVSDRTLHEIYLPAFKAAAIEGGAWSFMGAYNKFRGQHACHNARLNKILKQDWGWDGLFVSDWNGTHDTKEAAENGLDIEMGTWTDGLNKSRNQAYDQYYLATPFIKALKSGQIDTKFLDEKVRRILRLMFRTNMDQNRPMGRMNNVEHHKVAKKVAEEGIVLLKNQDKFFPFNPEAPSKIAIIGENAVRSMTVGGGSSKLKAKFEISPLEGIKERFNKADIQYVPGYFSSENAYARTGEELERSIAMRAEAIELARKSDVVIVIGGLNKNKFQDSEASDREQYKLPYYQEELIKELANVNANIGVLLISGNAVEMNWINDVKGIMQAWYLGSMAGDAIASILAGDANPSGKMPFSVPVKLEDNAAHASGKAANFPGIGEVGKETVVYDESIFVGYRWHDSKKIKPQYAFGYGLSYTRFELTNIKVDKQKYEVNDTIKVECKLSNVGEKSGAEVIQVYIGKPKSKVERALKELKGFQKVNLDVGSKEMITIGVPVEKLKFYNEKLNDWELENGKYTVYVGNSSDNIVTQMVIEVK